MPMLILPILPFPAIDPVLISIGPFAVRWYALAYIVGIIAGWFYARAIVASKRWNLSSSTHCAIFCSL